MYFFQTSPNDQLKRIVHYFIDILKSANASLFDIGISGFTVVGNPAATVITSFSGLICRSPNFGDINA
jgi:hypothetical protein